MTTIPQLGINSFWSKMYQPSTVSNVNSLLPENIQLDKLTQSFQSFKSLSVKNVQSQAQYRKNIVDLTDSAKSVSSSAKALSSAATFTKKAVSGSTDGAITGVAKDGAKATQYHVSVSQVAISQKNESSKLTGNSYGAVASGVHTFAVKAGSGAEKQVAVSVAAGDNNKQVLAKFAKAINNSGAGVTAEVRTKDNQQYLSVVSKETGAANSFTMRDVNGTGVASLQLGNKVQDGTDAKYAIDGVDYQSASNTVTMDKGNVSLSLNKITKGTTTLTVAKDDSSIVTGAKDLVTNYNKLNSVLSNSDTTKRGSKVLDGIGAMVNGARSKDFAGIGISMNKDTGELKLDEKKLAEAVSNNPDQVKKLVSGGGGLAKGIENVAKDISNNSVMNYLKSPSKFNVSDYSFQFNSNIWETQQTFLNQGLFFNMTV